MAETTNLRNPILVAIWPGMGSVRVPQESITSQIPDRRHMA